MLLGFLLGDLAFVLTLACLLGLYSTSKSLTHARCLQIGFAKKGSAGKIVDLFLGSCFVFVTSLGGYVGSCCVLWDPCCCFGRLFFHVFLFLHCYFELGYLVLVVFSVLPCYFFLPPRSLACLLLWTDSCYVLDFPLLSPRVVLCVVSFSVLLPFVFISSLSCALSLSLSLSCPLSLSLSRPQHLSTYQREASAKIHNCHTWNFIQIGV